MGMIKGSIAARLFWFSALWLIIALGATAFLLTELYSRALDRSLVETLNFNIETIVAWSLETGAPDSEAVVAADPRFNRPVSGWYWQILDADGEFVNASNSLIGSVLPQVNIPFDAQNARTQVITDGFGVRLRAIERIININEREFAITVTGSLDDITELTDQFRTQTLIVLVAIGAMLALMSAIVGRIALRPVGDLRSAIENVREGETERVEGEYPSELKPLAGELNELLRANTQILERARSQVGNLAHGLKTPLAVLLNEAAGKQGELAKVVSSETERMSTMVTTYLDRAQLSSRTAIIGKRANASSVLDRLVRVMQKLNSDHTLSLSRDPQTELWFRGEESDLEEILGNVLDNACKWSNGEVRVSLTRDGSNPEFLRFLIEDDGPGLGSDKTETVLRRGVRLDEKVTGTGLGLDIVKELVDVYGGTIELSASDMGGLRVEIKLPAAKSPN